jgi:hypothetical protein
MAIRGRAGMRSSPGRVAKRMGSQQYQAAVERGKKAQTGQKLKARRKALVKDAEGDVAEARAEWDRLQGAYKKEAGGARKWWDIASTVFTLASMFAGPLAPTLNMTKEAFRGLMLASSLASGAGGTMAQNKANKEFFQQNRGNFISSKEKKKYKGTFLEDYISGAAEDIQDTWDTTKDKMSEAQWGGFMSSAMMQIAGHLAGGGGKTGGGGKGLGTIGKGGNWLSSLGEKLAALPDKMGSLNLNPGAGMQGAVPAPATSYLGPTLSESYLNQPFGGRVKQAFGASMPWWTPGYKPELPGVGPGGFRGAGGGVPNYLTAFNQGFWY